MTRRKARERIQWILDTASEKTTRQQAEELGLRPAYVSQIRCAARKQGLAIPDSFEIRGRQYEGGWAAIDKAKRCQTCRLLEPCGGHPTIDFYASARTGAGRTFP